MNFRRVLQSEYILLALLTLPAILSLLLNAGLPNTADGVLHIYRTFELDRTWREGVLYPRLAPDFAFGYGYPIFNYYAPLFYFAGEVLHFIGLNLEWAVKAIIVLIFYGYALGMYLLARQWLPRGAAFVAAAAYLYAPYRFYEAFIQGDYPQFLALALVPFCLWAATPLVVGAGLSPLGWAAVSPVSPDPLRRTTGERPKDAPARTMSPAMNESAIGERTRASLAPTAKPMHTRRYAVAFIAAYGSLILSHNISALIVTPLIGAYILFISLWSATRHSKPVEVRVWFLRGLYIAFVIALSVALTAFFWLPALGEQRYVRIEKLTRGFFDFRNYFLTPAELLSPNIPPDLASVNPYIPFNLGPVIVCVVVLGLVFQLALRIIDSKPLSGKVAVGVDSFSLLEKTGISENLPPLSLHLFFALAALAMAAMTLPLSSPLWEHVPLLALAEFPWRFVGVAGLPLAMLAGFAVSAAGAQLSAGGPLSPKIQIPPSAVPHLRPVRGADRVDAVICAFALVLVALDCFVFLFPRTPFLPYTDVSLSDITRFEIASQAIGTTSAGEYLPIWTERRMVDSPLTPQLLRDSIPDHLQRESLPVTVRISVLADTTTRAAYHIASAGVLTVHLQRIYFPGWTASIDGKPVALDLVAPEGTMRIEVPAGDHRVEFNFGETVLRQTADLVSLSTLLAIAVWLIITQWHGRHISDPSARNPDALIKQPLLPEPVWLAAFTLLVFSFIAPHIGYVRISHLPQVEGMQHARGDKLGSEMTLLGYDLSTNAMNAGDALNLTLYWQPQQVSHKDYAVFAHLDNPQTLETVAQTLNDHPGNISTVELPLSLYVRDPHVLRVPADVEPGIYLLRIGMLDPRTNIALTVTQSDGSQRTRDTLQNIRVRRAAPPDLSGITRAGAHFGDIELIGYTLAGQQLTLYWRAPKLLNADATVFVHVRDASGKPSGTFDGPPAGGLLPTSAWDANEIVVDRRTLTLSGGGFQIALGLYDPQSQQRYSATNANGQKLPNDEFVIRSP